MKTEKKRFLFLLLICVFLELAVFNFKHWEAYTFPSVQSGAIAIGAGLEQLDEDSYRITDSGQAYFEITDINERVDNVYLPLRNIGAANYPGSKVKVHIAMTDAANSQYRNLPETQVVAGIRESDYIRLHLIGESSRLRIYVQESKDFEFSLSEIQLNSTRPLIIHPLRLLVMFLICFLYLLFNSRSKLFCLLLDYKDKQQRRLIWFLVALHMLVLGLAGVSALPFVSWKNDTWRAHAQYEDLTDALLDGHFYLNEEPAASLQQLENPYDSTLRAKTVEAAGESFLFDFAYYQGHYYCYFGILPALLFFLPFKLITGVHLQTWIAVVFCGLLYCPAGFYLIYQIAKKHFRSVSLGLYLLLASVFVASSSVLYLVHFGNVYSMPIMLGLLLAVTGLALWIHSRQKQGNPTRWRLILGSLLIALVMGCRPQLAIVLLLAFPIFWEDIKEKRFFSKKGTVNTLCVILPFLVIGAFLMYYNYARFGSPFDFGANYNLTSNDMTHKGWVFSRNFLGIFEYLFQPLRVVSTFPFLEAIDLRVDYQGYLSTEPLLGGYFAYNLITLFCFGIWKYRRELKTRRMFGFCAVLFVSAVVIIEANIQMSGLTQRYMSDFGWLLSLSALPVVMCVYETLSAEKKLQYLFLRMIILLSVVCVCLNYMSIFLTGRYASLIDTDPFMFYWMKYAFLIG